MIEQGRWDAENYERLRALLEGPPGNAIFDFDNTLIYNDLGEACMYFLARRGLLPAGNAGFQAGLIDSRYHSAAEQEAVAKYGKDYGPKADEQIRDAYAAELLHLYDVIHQRANLETTYRWTRIFFMGRTPAELAEIAREVFAYELERPVGREDLKRAGTGEAVSIPTGIRVVPEVAALVKELQARDWNIRVVTASPRIVIAAVIEGWGLSPDQVTGMELEPGADGNLLPNILEPMPAQAGKIDALKTAPGWADASVQLMSGDSKGDRELLALADNGILFDRGDDEMRAEAKQNGYILQKQFPPVDG